MMRSIICLSMAALLLSSSACTEYKESDETEIEASGSAGTLALCLTDKGYVMYGSNTCSGCRSQQKLFGPAFAHIRKVECNPHAPNNEAERCLNRKIRTTPTWIQEQDGAEIRRLEGYQLLEDLASFAECDLQEAAPF